MNKCPYYLWYFLQENMLNFSFRVQIGGFYTIRYLFLCSFRFRLVLLYCKLLCFLSQKTKKRKWIHITVRGTQARHSKNCLVPMTVHTTMGHCGVSCEMFSVSLWKQSRFLSVWKSASRPVMPFFFSQHHWDIPENHELHLHKPNHIGNQSHNISP